MLLYYGQMGTYEAAVPNHCGAVCIVIAVAMLGSLVIPAVYAGL